MKITSKGQNIAITELQYFSLKDSFENGQNFRFEKIGDNLYRGMVAEHLLTISQDNDSVTIHRCDIEAFENIWRTYLALDIDYQSIRTQIDTDEHMHAALQYGKGLRILKQDLWEMIVSFIVSQNNNIKRIRKIISSICEMYGKPIIYEAHTFYAFPTPTQMKDATEQSLRDLGLGYRSAYLIDAIEQVLSGRLDLNNLKTMGTSHARNELMQIKGIGGKVADCILLFGMSRYEVCPHDVWVKRIFSEKYGVERICEKTGYAFAVKKWGQYAGIAQQYLFYYEREHAHKKES